LLILTEPYAVFSIIIIPTRIPKAMVEFEDILTISSLKMGHKLFIALSMAIDFHHSDSIFPVICKALILS
jgi:hypothetical protein